VLPSWGFSTIVMRSSAGAIWVGTSLVSMGFLQAERVLAALLAFAETWLVAC